MDPDPKVFGLFDRDKFEDIEKAFKIIASLAAVIGIIVGVVKISFDTTNTKRQTTLDVLKAIQSEKFIDAFRRLQVAMDAHSPQESLLTEQLLGDRDILLNTYFSVAINYQNETVDGCLVKSYTSDALPTVLSIFEYLQLPPKAYEKISTLRISLETLKCPSDQLR